MLPAPPPSVPTTHVAEATVPGFGVWDVRLQSWIGWLYLVIAPVVHIALWPLEIVTPAMFANESPYRAGELAISISMGVVTTALTAMGAWGGYRLLQSRSDAVDGITVSTILGFASFWVGAIASVALGFSAGPQALTPEYKAFNESSLEQTCTAIFGIVGVPMLFGYLVAVPWCWIRRPHLLEADRRRLFPQSAPVLPESAAVTTVSPLAPSDGTLGPAS